MKQVHEVLGMAWQHLYYQHTNPHGCEYICDALDRAMENNEIDRGEYDTAVDVILAEISSMAGGGSPVYLRNAAIAAGELPSGIDNTDAEYVRFRDRWLTALIARHASSAGA